VGSVVGCRTIFSKQLGLSLFQVGFQWPSVVGLIVTVVVGYTLSFVIPEKAGKDNWTFRGVMNRTEAAKSGDQAGDEVAAGVNRR